MRQANTFYGRTEAAEATRGKRADIVRNDRLDSAHLLLLGAWSLASGAGSQADELHIARCFHQTFGQYRLCLSL